MTHARSTIVMTERERAWPVIYVLLLILRAILVHPLLILDWEAEPA